MPRNKQPRQRPDIPDSRARYLASVWDSPLPDGVAQLVLVGLIAGGHTCYCYQRQLPGRPWYVWIHDLQEVRGSLQGSVPLDEWEQNYAAILREFYPGPVIVDAPGHLLLPEGRSGDE